MGFRDGRRVGAAWIVAIGLLAACTGTDSSTDEDSGVAPTLRATLADQAPTIDLQWSDDEIDEYGSTYCEIVADLPDRDAMLANMFETYESSPEWQAQFSTGEWGALHGAILVTYCPQDPAPAAGQPASDVRTSLTDRERAIDLEWSDDEIDEYGSNLCEAAAAFPDQDAFLQHMLDTYSGSSLWQEQFDNREWAILHAVMLLKYCPGEADRLDVR